MHEPSPCRTLTILLIVAMMVGGLLLAAAPASGQVVIDMPPPPAAEREKENEKEKEKRNDADAREEARPSGEDANEADEANADAASAESKEAPSPASRISHRHAANDVGRLALARYTGARQYARPNDPYLLWGYQPRGRGVGPWGLGNHPLWYGNVHAITPAVFIGGRGEKLFR